MSLFARRAATLTDVAALGGHTRARSKPGKFFVDDASAMRHSAVWACLRLRADLISTMPVDTYRKVKGVRVEVPKPPVLVTPDGGPGGIQEWLYASQVDLDRAGNCFGLVTARDGNRLPARIELQRLADVSVRANGSTITEVRVSGQKVALEDVWHEKQYPVAGMPLGLSPVAHAAWSIEESMSAQQFALDWFGGSAIPMAELKNTAKTINKREAQVAKDAFRAAVADGDLFVHGNDWEYKPIQTVAASAAFLDARSASVSDVARFFGCPGDMIDAAVQSGNITYANIGQRNQQLLTMHVGPAVSRRETALSRLTLGDRFVKLNRSALLAMDPETRARVLDLQVKGRLRTNTEARAVDDLPPLTAEDIEEFATIYGGARTQPTEAQA
ncbi:phage portal protein [Actinoplanes sp. NPDC049316]|uniref:phage portal protein n=1 Tax=Actinoplanes sp. NPDC049316 TaxID=3154727 RepID=UPI0034451EA7